MSEKIYVTYFPTTAPESYHTAIPYERRDAAGNLVHTTIDATPERGPQLSTVEKIWGVGGVLFSWAWLLLGYQGKVLV